MAKWICLTCSDDRPCTFENDDGDIAPKYCPLGFKDEDSPFWVTEEAAETMQPAPPPRKRLSEAIADAIRGYTLQSSIDEAIQAVLAREGVDDKECKA